LIIRSFINEALINAATSKKAKMKRYHQRKCEYMGLIKKKTAQCLKTVKFSRITDLI
jgi:hypothetical protein